MRAEGDVGQGWEGMVQPGRSSTEVEQRQPDTLSQADLVLPIQVHLPDTWQARH